MPSPSSLEDPLSIRVALRRERVARRLFLVCISCEAVLVLLDLLLVGRGLVGYPPVENIFNVSSESSIANFFSSVQTLAVGVVLWLVRRRVLLEGEAARWRRRGWGALALFFLYLGVDDGAMIHERLGSFASHLGGALLHRAELAFGSYTWQLVLGPVFALAGVLMLVFLWRELRGSPRTMVALALVCYAMAVGLDYVEGRPGALTPLVPLLGLHLGTIQHLAQLVEEAAEMFGTTLFLVGFSGHLLALTARLEVELT